MHLLPVLLEELPAFGGAALTRRLLHGGLPPALMAEVKKQSLYREWLDGRVAALRPEDCGALWISWSHGSGTNMTPVTDARRKAGRICRMR